MVIGAGDCPRCEGDVVFDLHGGEAHGGRGREDPPSHLKPRRGLLRRLLRG